jgi:hypothetical protein
LFKGSFNPASTRRRCAGRDRRLARRRLTLIAAVILASVDLQTLSAQGTPSLIVAPQQQLLEKAPPNAVKK